MMGARRLQTVLGLWALLVASVGDAAGGSAFGSADARVREIEYRENQVVSLVGYVGYHIHLELAAGETFVALGAGDSAGDDAEQRGVVRGARESRQREDRSASTLAAGAMAERAMRLVERRARRVGGGGGRESGLSGRRGGRGGAMRFLRGCGQT